MKYFDLVYTAFQQAVSRVGSLEHVLAIGDLTIVLRFAGPGLIPRIFPALSQLAVSKHNSEEPGLTICLWDSASTGVELPSPPQYCRPESLGVHRRVKAIYQPALGIASMLDCDRALAIFWTPDAERITLL